MKANLVGAKIYAANRREAGLYMAYLKEANLSGTNLSWALVLKSDAAGLVDLAI